MIEGIRKSDHRPVCCQYILHDTKREMVEESSTLLLRLQHLLVKTETNEKVVFSKVCCPLPSEDANWEERQVMMNENDYDLDKDY